MPNKNAPPRKDPSATVQEKEAQNAKEDSVATEKKDPSATVQEQKGQASIEEKDISQDVSKGKKYIVCKGKSITCKKGILKAGDIIEASDLHNGKKDLDFLVDQKVVQEA